MTKSKAKAKGKDEGLTPEQIAFRDGLPEGWTFDPRLKLGIAISPSGRSVFAPGNKLSKGGTPFGMKRMNFTRVMCEEIKDEDIRKITRQLIKVASSGSIEHIKELFNRAMGKVDDSALIERLHELELRFINAGVLPDPNARSKS